MKKVLSLILCLCMVLSVGQAALANEAEIDTAANLAEYKEIMDSAIAEVPAVEDDAELNLSKLGIETEETEELAVADKLASALGAFEATPVKDQVEAIELAKEEVSVEGLEVAEDYEAKYDAAAGFDFAANESIVKSDAGEAELAVAYYTGVPSLPTYTWVNNTSLYNSTTTSGGYYAYSYRYYEGEWADYVTYVCDYYGWSLYEVIEDKANYTLTAYIVKGDAMVAVIFDAYYDLVTIMYKPTSSSTTVNPTGVSLNISSRTMIVGNEYEFIATVSPSNATNKSLTWSSSNSSVASVSSDGIVTAKKAGSATITVKTSNGKTDTCAITVKAFTLAYYPNTQIPTFTCVTGMNPISGPSTSSDGKNIIYLYNLDVDSAIDYMTYLRGTAGWSLSDSDTDDDTYYSYLFTKNGKILFFHIDFENRMIGVLYEKPVTEVAVTSVTLDKTWLSVTAGTVVTLTATVAPSNATNKSLTWTSSNTSVATVNSNGVVTTKAEGSATITAKSANGKTAQCSFKVTAATTPVTSVTFDKTWVSVSAGSSFTITPTVLPANATNKTLTWTSSNTSVATVNSNGVVTAKGEGSAQIKATSTNGKVATCSVKVTAASVAVTSVTFDKTWVSVSAGNSFTITPTVAPSNATNKNLTWTSSNPSVATVSNGVVTGVSEGSAQIKATASNGKVATCSVKVTAATTAVTSITFDKTWVAVAAGNSFAITATVAPSNATNKTLTWTSSNPSVATVNSNGVVTGISAGSAQIKATSSNGKVATCSVKVTAPTTTVDATGISIWVPVRLGAILRLSATVSPSNATNKTVTWSTSNSSIASITSDGTVVANSLGQVVITATTVNGKTATLGIEVVE